MSESLEKKVLRILAGQSPGYYAFPNASAFWAEELDPVQVAAALDKLHKRGKVERELLELDPDGPPVPGGYRLPKEEA